MGQDTRPDALRQPLLVRQRAGIAAAGIGDAAQDITGAQREQRHIDPLCYHHGQVAPAMIARFPCKCRDSSGPSRAPSRATSASNIAPCSSIAWRHRSGCMRFAM